MDYISGMDLDWRTHELSGGTGEIGLKPAGDEWLLTNGAGAYAMGTASGVNTRRWHGLFVPCVNPPLGHVVAVHQMLEQIRFSGGEVAVCGMAHGNGGSEEDEASGVWGESNLLSFEKGLSVRWTYLFEGVAGKEGEIEFVRELCLHWRHQGATIRYSVRSLSGSLSGAVLRLAPMLTLREALGPKDKGGETGGLSVEPIKDGEVIRVCRGSVGVSICCEGGAFVGDSSRSGQKRGVSYHREADERDGVTEYWVVPGWFEVGLGDGAEASIALTVTLGDMSAITFEETQQARRCHLEPIVDYVREKIDREIADDSVARVLAMATDDFVVEIEGGNGLVKSIVEGYPATGVCSAEVCAVIPGLLLATGRFEEACGVLKRLAGSLQDGLMTESLDGGRGRGGCPLSVDASLWFVHAAIEYLGASGDRVNWDGWLAGSVMKVIEAILHGTEDGVSMAGDGLIVIDPAHADGCERSREARGEEGVGARYGKLVEINVLWYNALAGVAACVTETHRSASEHYTKLTKRVKRSFGRMFWDESIGYLRDRVWSDENGNERDDQSLRSNQIFAVSLPRSPLPNTKKRRVLKVIREGLLTPNGLRSQAEVNRSDHGSGGAMVVYPWLLGPYAESILRAGGFNSSAVSQARGVIRPLLEWLAGRGLGQLPEKFECGGMSEAVCRAADARLVAEAMRVCCMLNSQSH